MSWRAYNLAENRLRFILIGGGITYHGEVWKGAMKGEVFWGLKALQFGAHAQAKIRNAWTVSTPFRVGAIANTGENRRFIRLTRPRGSGCVLRFREVLTPELVQALKDAFRPLHEVRSASHTEESHEEHEERQRGQAHEVEERGQGGLRGQGDAERDVQSVRQDAPRERQPRRQVAKRTAKPKRRK